MSTVRKHSKKREAIYKAIASTRTHPNAEWVYEKVKPSFPDLSLGTVYRNLSLFRKEGSIVCVGAVKGQERFDCDTHPHAHFICRDCGEITDIEDVPNIEYPEVNGEIDSYQLSFYGSCRPCCDKKMQHASDQNKQS